MSDSIIARLMRMAMQVGATKHQGPVRSEYEVFKPEYYSEGENPIDGMMHFPPPVIGQRQSTNVQDYRGYNSQGIGDWIADRLRGYPMYEDHRPRQLNPKAWGYGLKPTPEQLSGALPPHWPRGKQ